MDIRVIPNIFPISYEDAVYDLLMSDNFQWYYNATTAVDDGGFYQNGTLVDTDTTFETPQFTHIFFKDTGPVSEHFRITQTMKWLIEKETNRKIFGLGRIKANLLPVNAFYPDNFHHTIHIDDDDPQNTSFLYYVNDSDGDTLFFENGKEIFRQKPVKGTGILFRSNIHHCSTPPKQNVRVVVNMVLRFL